MERQRELALLSLEEALKGLVTLYRCLKGGCSKVEVSLFPNKLQDKRKWPQVAPEEV